MLSPETILADGVAILEPLLRDHGFEYLRGEEGTGSGGKFARGRFVKGNRRLELHVRTALGLVRYHVGRLSLSHDDYMRALTESKGDYPGYSDDPLDGFRHLLSDLEHHGEVFLSGSDGAFRELHDRAT